MSTERASIVGDVIRSRRTIHAFKPECPPAEIIREAIDLARWAPNHRHTEPWQFHWLGPEAIRQIVDLNSQIVAENKGPEAAEVKRLRWREVPGWLAVSCRRSSEDAVLDQEDYAATCCAIQNFQLYLWSHGIGVKWGSGKVTRHAALFDLLKLNPDEVRVVGLLWYGYAKKVPEQQRKPVDEILVELP